MSGSKSSVPGVAAPLPPEPAARDGAALQPVLLAVHSMPTPDLADPVQAQQRRTARGRLQMLLVLLACAAPVVASYFTYFVVRPEGRTNYSTLILPTRSLPPTLALTTLDGQPVATPSLRGQWLLVAVGPSACADACERRLFTQRQLREMLGRERHRVDKVWFVTDSGPVPPVLHDNLASRDTSAVTMLRADRAALAQWLAPQEGQALEDHLYLVDPMGEWMMRIPPQPEPSRVKRDLERLLRAAGSWDTPGR